MFGSQTPVGRVRAYDKRTWCWNLGSVDKKGPMPCRPKPLLVSLRCLLAGLWCWVAREVQLATASSRLVSPLRPGICWPKLCSMSLSTRAEIPWNKTRPENQALEDLSRKTLHTHLVVRSTCIITMTSHNEESRVNDCGNSLWSIGNHSYHEQPAWFKPAEIRILTIEWPYITWRGGSFLDTSRLRLLM